MSAPEIDLDDLLVAYLEKLEIIHEQPAPFESMVRVIRHEHPELPRDRVCFLCINLWLELKDEPLDREALCQLKVALEQHFLHQP